MAEHGLTLEIVTLERKVWEDDDLVMVVLPGIEGELGILPRHTPLLTTLKPGVIAIRRQDGTEELFAVGGGFAEVRPNKVTVLAQSAEHSEEIDLARAEAALQRAEQALQSPVESGPSVAVMRQALMRSQVRLKIANRRHRSPGMPARDTSHQRP